MGFPRTHGMHEVEKEFFFDLGPYWFFVKPTIEV